jgi:hypothetical protein
MPDPTITINGSSKKTQESHNRIPQNRANPSGLIFSESMIDQSIDIQGVECTAEVPPPGNLIEIELYFQNPD